MKKTILMLVTASALVVGTTACKKEKEHEEPEPKAAIVQTIDVKMKANESYSFTLPKNIRDDAYEITSDAAHFTVSKLSVNSSGDRVYEYTPEAGYVGNDQVIVSNDWEREEHMDHPHHHQGPPPLFGKRHHHGDCKKGEQEDHYIITFNFVMDRNSDTEGK